MAGPLIIGVEGEQLTSADQQRLRHRLVGGVILFARNYSSQQQLRRLTDQIKQINSKIVIMVDQEGGRIQRFSSGFTALPSAAQLAAAYQHNERSAARYVGLWAELLALELLLCGVDLTLAPVLDRDYNHNQVIGSRAWHYQNDIIIAAASQFNRGLRCAGFKPIGKHFPGHGYAAGDTHTDSIVDGRPLVDLEQDMLPFIKLQSKLSGIMLSHVIYPALDAKPASTSLAWVRYLRQQMGYQGVLISDDMGMSAVASGNNAFGAVKQVINVGVDLVIIGNDFALIDSMLAQSDHLSYANKSQALAKLKPDRCFYSSRQIGQRISKIQQNLTTWGR